MAARVSDLELTRKMIREGKLASIPAAVILNLVEELDARRAHDGALEKAAAQRGQAMLATVLDGFESIMGQAAIGSRDARTLLRRFRELARNIDSMLAVKLPGEDDDS